ncbi:hypothetical protein B0T11DRAFT_7379 [Plectosphaerella cucumerina]|uniref:Uncharacterized protein n=1 Tax=Plectosphaerella cucumerina TaxID=40658 RepID=A0A8K0X8D4_9PEZI|nr:hypothetical protein B0T11DRAFT_7379 [Plectosphaerella cucumerina]
MTAIFRFIFRTLPHFDMIDRLVELQAFSQGAMFIFSYTQGSEGATTHGTTTLPLRAPTHGRPACCLHLHSSTLTRKPFFRIYSHHAPLRRGRSYSLSRKGGWRHAAKETCQRIARGRGSRWQAQCSENSLRGCSNEGSGPASRGHMPCLTEALVRVVELCAERGCRRKRADRAAPAAARSSIVDIGYPGFFLPLLSPSFFHGPCHDELDLYNVSPLPRPRLEG